MSCFYIFLTIRIDRLGSSCYNNRNLTNLTIKRMGSALSQENPRTLYTDMDIRFSMDGVSIRALNIGLEHFDHALPSHSHGNGCYELHYIPRGFGKLKIGGNYGEGEKKETVETIYDITPNTLFVTGPHVEHFQAPVPPDPMQEYFVYLKINNSSRKRASSPVLDAFTAVPFWIGKDTQGIHALMQQLFDELANRYTGYQNQVELLLSQLLIYIVRNYEYCQPSRTVFSKNNLTDSKSVIIEEYFLYEYQNLSLETLADKLKLSTRQTQRLLLEYYGKTFQQKKAEAKMSAAAILLSDTSKSISCVAEDLGYSSAEHFSSAFHRYYQISPREYRKHGFTLPFHPL